MSGLIAFHFNGHEAAAAPAGSRGLHYGDGVFRTLLRYGGVLFDEQAQLDKLLADAQHLGLAITDDLRQRLSEELDGIAAEADTAVLKVLLVRSGEGRGYAAAAGLVDRYLYAYLPPRYPESCWREGIAASRSPFRLGGQPMLAGIKHLNRLEQVMAYRSAPASSQEILLSDQAGNVICGGRSNLFAVREGVLCTPDLSGNGVNGMMRTKVLKLAAAQNIRCRVECLSGAALEQADELFVTNSLIGIWPIRLLDGQSFAAPGTITQALAQQLDHPRLS